MSEEKKKEEKVEEQEKKVDVKGVIKSLGETDWGKDNEAQMKAVQLLKGIALSEDPLSNKFMKQLSDASTVIAQNLLKEATQNDAQKEVIDEASRYV